MQANVGALEASVEAALANVAASEANVQRLLALQSFQKLEAPFAGIITARGIDRGALITSGSGSSASPPLFRIARVESLRIFVNVPQSYVRSIAPGQRAKIRVAEYPQRTFEGTVAATAGALDAASRTLLTEVRLRNEDGALMPGMYAQVGFSVVPADAVWLVPGPVLVARAAGPQVITVQPDGTVHYVNVQLGRDLGQSVEIIGGLTGTERLVHQPPGRLEGRLARRRRDGRSGERAAQQDFPVEADLEGDGLGDRQHPAHDFREPGGRPHEVAAVHRQQEATHHAARRAVGVDDDDQRPGDPSQLGQQPRGLLVGEVVQAVDEHGLVEVPGRILRPQHVGDLEALAGVAGMAAARPVDELLVEVHADVTAGHRLGELPDAAADVEHGLVGSRREMLAEEPLRRLLAADQHESRGVEDGRTVEQLPDGRCAHAAARRPRQSSDTPKGSRRPRPERSSQRI